MLHASVKSFFLSISMLLVLPFAVRADLLYGTTSTTASATSSLYTIDPATGAATLVGDIGFSEVSGLDLDPLTGIMYAVGRRTSDLVLVTLTINLATGAGTVKGATGGIGVNDLSFRSDGVLFGHFTGASITDFLRTINLTTGASTNVGGTNLTGLGHGGNAIAFGTADTLWHAHDKALYTLNQSSGASTFVRNLTISDGADILDAMDFHAGVPYAISVVLSTGTYRLVTVDLSAGTTTTIGTTTANMEGLAWGPPTDSRLPVELTSFTGLSFGGTVQLDWQTASEIRNAGFEVERAGSDSVFVPIDSYLTDAGLSGLGTSSSGKSYQVSDGGDGSLVPGQTYLYRLTDITVDGVRTPHPAIAVTVIGSATPEFSSFKLQPVHPNPTGSSMRAEFSLEAAGPVTIVVHSVRGDLTTTLADGIVYSAGYHSVPLSTASLPAGTYFVELISGARNATERFIVIR